MEIARQIAETEHTASVHTTGRQGCRLVWRSWGKGPPLILLHGASGSWLHWIRNIEGLARHRTLWVPDLPGHGDSDRAPCDDHEAFQAMLAEGILALFPDAGPADIAGFSLGGVCGAYLAARNPKLVRHLVIVDSGGLGPPIARIAPAKKPDDEQAKQAWRRARARDFMLRSEEAVDDLALEAMSAGRRMCRLGPDVLTTFIVPDRLAGILPQVGCRVDAIWGEHDRLLPDPAAQRIALQAVKPDARLEVIAGASHWVMYEQPLAFNAAVLKMLDLPA